MRWRPLALLATARMADHCFAYNPTNPFRYRYTGAWQNSDAFGVFRFDAAHAILSAAAGSAGYDPYGRKLFRAGYAASFNHYALTPMMRQACGVPRVETHTKS